MPLFKGVNYLGMVVHAYSESEAGATWDSGTEGEREGERRGL